MTVHTAQLLHFSQEDLESYGLDDEQVKNLKRTFDQFDSNKAGALSVGTVQTILKMMGMHVSCHALQVCTYLKYTRDHLYIMSAHFRLFSDLPILIQHRKY